MLRLHKRMKYKAKKWLIMSTRQELVLVSHYWSPAGKGVRRDAFKGRSSECNRFVRLCFPLTRVIVKSSQYRSFDAQTRHLGNSRLIMRSAKYLMRSWFRLPQMGMARRSGHSPQPGRNVTPTSFRPDPPSAKQLVQFKAHTSS